MLLIVILILCLDANGLRYLLRNQLRRIVFKQDSPNYRYAVFIFFFLRIRKNK